ncbi:unnamed protein product [Parascedosporium putredinis]|uniref:PaxU n=1 Tax=Parascedosporium putredinis TaxID=1442378 RepID=A0A9P1M6E7_9PEZI|nr:unnamed protein product [Parascedosporium putredinis]CAI7989567.1 unnamed protein product [Parascedosporium putredinis]
MMQGELYALHRELYAMALAEKENKKPYFPGFTALSDQIYVRPGEEIVDKDAPVHGPRVVILFGWGDCIPKHVAKYTDGFRELFPHAKQIVVFAPIMRAMRLDVEQRTKNMIPVVKEAFPEGIDAEVDEDQVLFHVMSNTGGINYSATLNAYKQIHGRALPHRLAVYDSTPGSVIFTWENLKRWSYAMAIGTAGWFPWPFGLTQGIWGAFLLRILAEEEFKTKAARSLYLYSKEDDLILWEDIEGHIANYREAGYHGDAVMFEGSGHVGHMRQHPELYWKSIREAWANTAVTAEVAA